MSNAYVAGYHDAPNIKEIIGTEETLTAEESGLNEEIDTAEETENLEGIILMTIYTTE